MGIGKKNKRETKQKGTKMTEGEGETIVEFEKLELTRDRQLGISCLFRNI